MSNYSAQSELHILPPSAGQDQATEPERHRRTYYALPEDDQAVAAIRQRYGCSTESDAIRLALRLVAGDAVKITTAAPAARRIIVRFKSRTG